MPPLVTIMAALAAIEQTAKAFQTDQGQRIIKEALDGGAKLEHVVEKIVSAFSHLFHHDTQAPKEPANLVVAGE